MSITEYWRQCLISSEMDEIDVTGLYKAKVAEIWIDTGVLPQVVAQECFKNDPKGTSEETESINILIAPNPLGKNKKLLIHLWVPAVMDKAGNISVPLNGYPWIPRHYLEPTEKQYIEPIGTLEKYNEYFDTHPLEPQNWKEYWDYARDLFNYVTDKEYDTFTYQDYRHIGSPIIIAGLEKIQGTRKGIIKIYEQIKKRGIRLPLYERYSNLADRNCEEILNPEGSFHAATRHTGQMGNIYPCSPSQRESVIHHFSLSDGEILAVNGPPGTGKTTLIQSIVASMWVNAAEMKAEPPVMVVSSTNNQAVTNIIESFAKVKENDNPLAGRWLPGINTYGLYFPAKSKENQNTFPSPENLIKKLEEPEYIVQAEKYYLEKFAKCFQRQVTLDEAIEYLHGKITENLQEQRQKLTPLYEYFASSKEYKTREEFKAALSAKEEEIKFCQQEIQRIKGLNIMWEKHLSLKPWWYMLRFLPFLKKYIDEQNQHRNNFFIEQHDLLGGSEKEVTSYLKNEKERLANQLSAANKQMELIELNYQRCRPWFALDTTPEEYQEQMDINYRYTAFKLATHYWEARWLKEIREVKSRSKLPEPEETMLMFWRYAMLTPCFVTTLYTLPRKFVAWQDKIGITLFNFINLLIIDEAGQVLPEVGGASFALARKAIVMGDIHQIEPIRTLPKVVDVINLKMFGFDNNITKQDAEQILNSKYIGTSTGSVMQVAQRACKYQKFGERGMYLTEHRRCVPEIIKYCNELAYKGKLIPKRPSLTDYPFPNMGYVNIPGKAEKASTGYINPVEIRTIVKWIKDNQKILLELYPDKTIKDIVAVITPFRAQMFELSKQLQRAGSPVMTGTVHAFQGGERPIIIFSTVYDRSITGPYFFDSNINMLNVAVSRAQDSFLVFGDTKILDPCRPSPSGILARILFENKRNEIKFDELENDCSQVSLFN